MPFNQWFFEGERQGNRKGIGSVTLGTLLFGSLFGVSLFGASPAGAEVGQIGSCSAGVDDNNWDWELLKGTNDGVILKNVQFYDEMRIRYLTVPWIDLDVGDGALVWLGSAYSQFYGECYTNVTSTPPQNTIEFSVYGGSIINNDGYPSVKIDFKIVMKASGDCAFQITTNDGSATRMHPLYVDWDCSRNSSTDNSDDAVTFNDVHSLNYNYAEQRYETDMIGGHPKELQKYLVVDISPNVAWCAFVDSKNTNNDDDNYRTISYLAKCSYCSEDTVGSQYIIGPWDFIGSESTWSQNIIMTITKERLSGTASSWQSTVSVLFYST